MPGYISVNGTVQPAAEAVVPAMDRGLLYGDAVFEAMVAFGSQILDCGPHLARLRTSAEILDIPVPWSDHQLQFELQALVDLSPSPKQHLRLVVSRGLGFGLAPPLDPQPNRLIYCLPVAELTNNAARDGIALRREVLPGTNRGAAPKTPNYLPVVLALGRAKKEGFDDVLWTNADGEITEAGSANIFFLQREGDHVEFVTPPAHSGLLLGVTRATVIALLQRAQIPISEQVIYADELPRYDEAFVTSTVRGLIPVTRIGRHQLHTARPNATYHHIARLFLTWAQTQLGTRVDWATGKPVTA